jgi:hypothetical protein
MGQTKKLLDVIFELDECRFPDDMDFIYESWLNEREQKLQEQLAYEELLSDSK